jgi:hypothetical protein
VSVLAVVCKCELTRGNRVWGIENSGDQLTRAVGGSSVDVHIDNPAEELNYREYLTLLVI